MTQDTSPPTAGAANPANAPAKQLPTRERIPMSLPVQKLAVPEIPGWHCHWMRGDPQRINQALRAGYTYVDQDEVDMSTFGVANGPGDSGHSDLGTRVSFISGREADGGVERLYLMKLPMEYWLQDQGKYAEMQEQTAAQLRGQKGFIEAGGDNSNRYANVEVNKNIFLPKRRA